MTSSFVLAATIQGERAGASTASPAIALSSRPNQLQRLTHTGRGNPWGMCAPILAVDDAQDRPALTLRAGFTSPDLPTSRGFGPGASYSHRLASLPSRKRAFRGSFLLPENRGARTYSRCLGLQAFGAIFPSRATGCNPVLAQSLTHKPLHYLALREIHHLNSPFEVLVRCINKCTQARTINWLSHPKKSRVK